MLQFHILSFEGPDDYSRAGGLSSRIEGLFEALVEREIETHLWFVGDPLGPGRERAGTGHLHRWCQWISRHHPGGVYDGEDGKVADYSHSLPPRLIEGSLGKHLMRGGSAVVLAEDWHTAGAMLHLDWLLRRLGLRARVALMWNANSTVGLDRVEWERLSSSATITTVSRYMKHVLAERDVQALVIPNGVSREVLERPASEDVRAFRGQLRQRVVLTKVAGFRPDKRWGYAIECVAALKRRGLRPLLVARGGKEPYGEVVLDLARAMGLKVLQRPLHRPGPAGLIEATCNVGDADILNLLSRVDGAAKRVLFRASDAVLANSTREPFGHVGLETMAAGGIACTGCSGEDYAVPNRNALVLQTEDPDEFVTLYRPLGVDSSLARSIRRAARSTARDFAWSKVVAGSLLPHARLATPRFAV